jgi:hypothetical protein
MERILYYVVEPQIIYLDGVVETMGYKDVTVYTIEDNVPKKFLQLDCEDSRNSEIQIQEYLDDNGYGDETFTMVQL